MKQSFEKNKRYVLENFPDSNCSKKSADFSRGINRTVHIQVLAKKLFANYNKFKPKIISVFLDSNNHCIGIIELEIFGTCVIEARNENLNVKYNGKLIQEIALGCNAKKVIIIEAGKTPSRRFSGLFGKKFPESVSESLETVNIEFIGYHYITPMGKSHINLGK